MVNQTMAITERDVVCVMCTWYGKAHTAHAVVLDYEVNHETNFTSINYVRR